MYTGVFWVTSRVLEREGPEIGSKATRRATFNFRETVLWKKLLRRSQRRGCLVRCMVRVRRQEKEKVKVKGDELNKV